MIANPGVALGSSLTDLPLDITNPCVGRAPNACMYGEPTFDEEHIGHGLGHV